MDDNTQALEIVRPIAQIAHAVTQGVTEGADAVLTNLDNDQSWENVVQTFTSLLAIETATKAAIGEGLVFLRYRKHFTPVNEFSLEEDDVSLDDSGIFVLYRWPTELFEFIERRYGKVLSKMEPVEMVEFTKWTAYKYEQFWLLVNFDGIIVWHKTDQKEFDDETYREYVGNISATLGSLSEGGLWRHYVTARTYPRSFIDAYPTVKWTTLFEARNVIASDPEIVDQSLKGEERIKAATEPAQEFVKGLVESGTATVTHVRGVQKQNAQRRRGYQFWIPTVPSLYVRDPEDGENYILVEFDDETVARYFQVRAGVVKDDAVKFLEIAFDEHGVLYYEDKEVGRLRNQDVGAVMNATTFLSNKMRWRPV